MVQVFIVEDHAIMRQSLRALLEQEADLTISGEAATGEAALDELSRLQSDLVLIDVSLPGMSGIELARSLRERQPELALAMLSGHGEKSHVDQAFAAGATGYILKGRADELAGAIRQIVRGERYVSPSLPGGEDGTGNGDL